MSMKIHDKLSEELIDLVAKQLYELQDSPVYSKPDVVTWLAGAVPPVFNNVEVAMERLVKAHRIRLKELTFNPLVDAHQPLWLDVLNKLKNIYFEQCDFSASELILKNAAIWYDECRFGKHWSVTMGKNPQALVDAGDPVYNACQFSGEVSIDGNETDEETLGLYGVVFQDCKMRSLFVGPMNLTTRLYVAPSEPIDVINKDRHNTHKTLQDLSAISTVFKKELDLNHLHVGEVGLTNCVFDDGINLSGFVCDRLSLNSCDVDGRFSLDGAHAKKVDFRDSHFKRSVIFDGGIYEVLLFSASSFEQILSLENSEVAEFIGLVSCSLGKQPNFLNCHLSQAVIDVADRETFRIVKNSFDAVGNNIEANRYFSYEMNAYLKELRQNAKGRVGERWLLELNHLISDHGQNYWKPLRLIFILPILYGLALVGYQEQWLYDIDPKLDLVLGNLSHCLNQYAVNFGIGFPKRAEGIEFIALLLGLVLSGLVWHFLVAIRRHKRR